MDTPRFFRTKDELPAGAQLLDTLPGARAELFFVENPSLAKGSPEATAALEAHMHTPEPASLWVFYPWRYMAVRIPEEAAYFTLRTARNRNLITKEEQQAYRAAVIGIAGLSVGSSALAALVATGGPKTVRLADPDTVDITNLNRIAAVLPDVGRNKTEVAAQRAWELDPFLNIEAFPKGVSAELLPRFIEGTTAIVDEMDAIPLKVALRLSAKALRTPVVMATDNGDSTILDVERFDLEPERPIFHGRIEIRPEEMETMTRDQFVRLANRIIDPALFTVRQQNSLMQIGTDLAGIPQLFTAATLSGAAVALAVRRITCGQDMPSGRYVLSLEEVLEPGHADEAQTKTRKENTERFNAHFG